jgi:hypothetical protein
MSFQGSGHRLDAQRNWLRGARCLVSAWSARIRRSGALLHVHSMTQGYLCCLFRLPECLYAEDLARVHYVLRIDSLFNPAHDVHGLTVLGEQEVDFAAADTVLAKAFADPLAWSPKRNLRRHDRRRFSEPLPLARPR